MPTLTKATALNPGITQTECLPSYPSSGGGKHKPVRRERVLTPVELKRLEDAFRQYGKEQPSSVPAISTLRFLLYTGHRVRETLKLKWEDVHLKGQFIYGVDLYGHKYARPLNQKAINILASLAPQEGNPYVFYGKAPGKPLGQLTMAWKGVISRADLKGFRISGLRHTYGAFSLHQGADFYAISKLLGYKDVGAINRLSPLGFDDLKKATDKASLAFT